MLAEFASYAAWVSFEEDCSRFGCRRDEKRFWLAVESGEEEVTDFVDRFLAIGKSAER